MLNKQLIPLIIFVIIALFLWQGLHLKPQLLSSALINKPVPSFALQSLDSNGLIITEQIFKDKISVINVWSSRCSTCKQEHLFLLGLNKIDEFQLVGINYKDEKNNADLWLNKLGNPYKVNIFDQAGSLSMDFGVYGTPTVFIIDRAAIIRYRHVGILTNEIWNDVIVQQINKLKD